MHIILLQILLTILTIGVFGWAIQFTAPAYLTDPLSHVRARTLSIVFACLILLTTIFGFLAARFALRPTKNSLQFQKRFIGNVAHEIRTPLAIIKTSTEVALMDPRLAQDVRHTLEETVAELDRISETINNLLSFDTLIRPGRIKSEPVDLTPLAQTVVERHSALAASRGIALMAQITPGEHRIIGNSVALEQVMTNLVKNALNYTPQHKGGSVTLSVENDYRGRVIVSVSDTGIGIAQKDLFHIFEPFYRAETSRARGVGSGTSGLGLAIVSEIVRLHRGTIVVRSALGRGTTFEIAFPRYAETANEAPAVSELGHDGMHEIVHDLSK